MISRDYISLKPNVICTVILILSACTSIPNHKKAPPTDKLLSQQIPTVYAVSEQILSCDPQALIRASTKNKTRIHLITNAQGLKKHARTQKKRVNLWLDWLESQGGLQIVRLKESSNFDQRRQSYFKLLNVLAKLGRGNRKPPSYIWFSENSDQFKDSISQQSTTLTHQVLPSPWLQIQKQFITWLSPHLSHSLSEAQCQSAISRILTHTAKSSSTVKQKVTLQNFYEQNKLLGLQLVKGPRSATPIGCVKLFNLENLVDSRTELDSQGLGWHLILRPSMSKKQDDFRSYLTLPVPSSATQIPTWKAKGIISKLWEKRTLWWGAQNCWQELDRREISSPLAYTKQRWVHQSRTHTSRYKQQSLHIDPLSLWQIGSNTQAALSSIYALAKESSFNLPLSQKGIIQAVLGPKKVIEQRLSQTTLLAHLTVESNRQEKPIISSLLLATLSPYIPYEALLQLDAQEQLFRLSYESKTISPSIVILAPWQKEKLFSSVQWESLQDLINSHHKKLLPNDLISSELSPITAGQFSGAASLFEGNPKAVLKEQLKRYLLMIPSVKGLKKFAPSSSHTVRFWPWFEPYTVKLQLPLEHLP